MALRYSADEILAMAQQIERNGADFYRRAAESAGDAKCRRLLQDLAGWEEEHLSTFTAMRAEFAAQGGGAAHEPGGEADLYLRAIVDGRVFDTKADPAAKLTGSDPLAEMLRTAIGLEKDSIVFYVGVKEMLSDNLGKDRVEGIIREEMSHVVFLNGELARA